MQYMYKLLIESLSKSWQPPWMAELEVYGKVVNTNKLFPQNDSHK